ncbi:MAG: hypothetical protein IPK32_10625 [Verrucomicrobiaceae bacterium]|nr:hypothetical protein [Verrucomicrobiaceae bacterium]
MNTLTAFFDWLLTTSLRTSILTLLVLGVQFMLRRQLSARARYALWLPVLIVLLTPVFPESRWSLENVFRAETAPLLPLPMLTEALIFDAVSEPITPPPAPIDWAKIGLQVWFGISLALWGFISFSFIQTLRRFKSTRLPISDELSEKVAQIAREVGLSRTPRVWTSAAIQSPAVTGLLQPILLLPALFERHFTAAESRLILKHELTHLKRHDLPLNALLCLLMALHWFNPLLWIAFYKARLDREAACDAQVLENAPPQRRVEYGHALLKAETAFAPLQLSLGFVGLFQRGVALRSRIQSIASHHQPHPAMKLITLASISLLTFLGITRAEEPFNVIGKAEFRPGDSIRITNVQRADDFLTVTADYELASESEATIALYITATKGDGRSKTAETQSKTITKGKGTVTLHHPAISEGMPHISFYPPKGGRVFGGVYFGTAAEAAASQKMEWSMTKAPVAPKNPLAAKLKAIILPHVAFTNATLEEAIEFIRLKSRDLDSATTDAAQKGVNIILKESAQKTTAKITLHLKDVPLGELLRYVTELSQTKFQMTPFAILITGISEPEVKPATATARAVPVAAKNEIILPQVEFQEATLDEAISFIRIKSRDADPAKQGVNILLKPGGGANAKITLSLKNVPVNEALRYIAELTGHKLSGEAGTYIIAPMK